MKKFLLIFALLASSAAISQTKGLGIEGTVSANLVRDANVAACVDQAEAQSGVGSSRAHIDAIEQTINNEGEKYVIDGSNAQGDVVVAEWSIIVDVRSGGDESSVLTTCKVDSFRKF